MSMDIRNAKAVFFDWDGTLVDSFNFLHGAHNHTRKTLGFEPFSLDVFSTYFGQPREKLYNEIYKEHKEDAKRIFIEYVYKNHMDGLKTIADAENLLKWFNQAGIPCGVVTNKAGELVAKEISNFGWDKYFVSLVGAGEAEADKPSGAPLKLAYERAGLSCDMHEVLFVGDTDNDLKCAENAGATSVFIEDHEAYGAVKSDNKVDYHFPTCTDFLDFLLQNDRNSLKA